MQSVHAPSAAAEHALDWNCPSAQTTHGAHTVGLVPVHGEATYWPLPQDPQGRHTVFVVYEQSRALYCPAPQSEHRAHTVSAKYGHEVESAR